MSVSGSRMRVPSNLMKSFSLTWVLLAAVVLSGCDRPDMPALKAGKTCTIQFRRDALGSGASLPVPPTTNSMNGADVSLDGTFVRATAEWVVIETKGSKKEREVWIPKGVILLIEQ